MFDAHSQFKFIQLSDIVRKEIQVCGEYVIKELRDMNVGCSVNW